MVYHFWYPTFPELRSCTFHPASSYVRSLRNLSAYLLRHWQQHLLMITPAQSPPGSAHPDTHGVMGVTVLMSTPGIIGSCRIDQ